MKVLFICGALEKGKDGVGDYTRRLAGELIRQGHHATIIAYNDRHIVSEINSEQEDEGTTISVLRLPSILKTREKVRLARSYVRHFQPDWISLQFVIYSFHPKGLPFFLAGQLKQIGEGYRWHIMFHELWLGIDQEASLKHKILGKIQKKILEQLISHLSPKRCHSHADIYVSLLNNIVPRLSKKLPLFSNISKYRGDQCLEIKPGFVNLIMFGSIQPNSSVAEFILDLKKYELQHNLKFQVIFIGKNGVYISDWIKELIKCDILYKQLGECKDYQISSVLQKCHWGITTTPLYQIEKSGSVATLLDHQLPIYVVARKWTPKYMLSRQQPNFIRQFIPGKLNLEFKERNTIASNSLSQVGSSFLADLYE
ncbi:Glycosyl transferase 4-like domain-containing protein [Sphingobacterium allocomposti]|uniref:Glycosyl transferase 4-like domain-containing protein n=1 Tax=Sphingobacterium allocomposti TaxID=415956 RepID=A0A5S5D565_9SPHI|nr:glycosyltransferase [Sphingobacterium composti Yoo et al. 2007 non Ten et al. 2007]TYP91081.1 Glycosyl transferase 4-like domain-containing protein [Sphingobacterium composti Yoo et al. 2007 non Ten et al. 2007]